MENANDQPKVAEVREKSQLMSGSEIDRTLVRLANEILERNNGLAGVVLVGIRRRGVPLADRLAKKMMEIEKTAPPVETIDITFYRDDLSTVAQKPVVQEVPSSFTVEGKTAILVDDVLYTGRTTRAALEALLDHGRPATRGPVRPNRPRPSRVAHPSQLCGAGDTNLRHGSD